MSRDDIRREPVEELAEEFLGRFRRGERPALSEYTARHPELAEEIRELFPALVLMEEAGRREPDRSPPRGPQVAGDGQPLRRLGDYRIVREVGRGGMGVVYEAVQEALGRHVALKVLPLPSSADPTRLERFRREARAAAGLHHTNIVPVFDVGECQGLHYYAMQFIQGESLDEVLVELRRLRGSSPSQRLAAAGPPPTEMRTSALARDLLTGQFRTGKAGCPEGGAGAAPRLPHGADSALTDGAASGTPRSLSDFSAESDFHFYRSVARVGLQAAEALAHAHGQKVLHRDIKPANLLLDAQGTVWVTDFGLARAEGSDDLTHTGDVVGTLRYLAPERFRGVSDPCGDIYSLGLTLYELLTLRPAFEETDRARLIQRLTQEQPVPPRKVDGRIPRDLETIVLKAIAREPARRYQTAEELAEDLQRFLADRPIQARRTSWREHAWRWVRRNPGWAATLGTALGLLLVMAAGGTVLSWHLHRALADTRAAEQDKTEKLWQSYLDRARAECVSGRVGQRFKALEAIRAAARIRVTPELRDEAVAALVLPDVELAREWDGCPDDTLGVAFDAVFERYVRLNKAGELTVCRLTDAGEEVVACLPAHGRPRFTGPWLSADGRFVAYVHGTAGGAGAFRVWKLGRTPAVVLDEPGPFDESSLAFSADGRRLAAGGADGSVSVYDLETRGCLRRLAGGSMPLRLAFDPGGGRLAVACPGSVRVFDLTDGHVRAALRRPYVASGVAWHPGGRRLATGWSDRTIYIVDPETATEVMPPWTGQPNEGVTAAFNHAGDRLVSCDWGQARLWDAATGRLLLNLPSYLGMQFSPDDRLLGCNIATGKVRLWRVAAGRELRVLRRRQADSSEEILSPAVDADGRVLAACSRQYQGLGFFDLDSGEELASVSLPQRNGAWPLRFDREYGWLTGGMSGLFHWPSRPAADRPGLLRVGPPRRLVNVEPRYTNGTGGSRDGSVLAVPDGLRAYAVHLNHPRRIVKLGQQYDVRTCAVSPDGRWVVTCSHFWDGRSKSAGVWDADSGRHVRDLPLEGGGTMARFSPDGRWLATATWGDGRLWEVGTWREARRFKTGATLFSPDSRLLAFGDVCGVVRLVEAESGREVARLTGPEPMWYTPACFTPDGTRLIATCSGHKALYVWDLRLIREGLKELGLDWELPAFPAPTRAQDARPVQVVIDPGELAAASSTRRLEEVLAEAGGDKAHFRRGLAHALLKRWSKALADCDRFLLQRPGDVAGLYLRGLAHQGEGRHREAVADFHAALGREPDRAPSLAEVQQALGQDAPSAADCHRQARKYITAAPGLRVVGLAHLLAEAAVLLEPGGAGHHHIQGEALYRLGRLEEAAKALEKAIELWHGRAMPLDLYFLAMSYHRLGQAARAREYFDRANVLRERQKAPARDRSLTALQAEAAAVLAQKPPSGSK